MKKPVSILFLCILSISIDAQVSISVSADKDSVEIGDPITLSYKAVSSGDPLDIIDFSNLFSIENLVYASDTVMIDKTADVSILSGGSLNVSQSNSSVSSKGMWNQSGSGFELETEISIAIYNIGLFAINPPEIEGITEANSIPLEPTLIMVSPPAGIQDSLSLAPIKPILEEPVIWQDYLAYLYAILGILALLLIGWFLFKKKSGDVPDLVIEEVIKPAPDVIALEKLQELKDAALWEKGEIKAYQTQLTYIIREYLEGRFDISALELTTGEILRELASKDFDKMHSNNLEKILQIADLIKFAKAKPTVDLHSKFMDMAIDFVKETKKTSEHTDL